MSNIQPYSIYCLDGPLKGEKIIRYAALEETDDPDYGVSRSVIYGYGYDKEVAQYRLEREISTDEVLELLDSVRPNRIYQSDKLPTPNQPNWGYTYAGTTSTLDDHNGTIYLRELLMNVPLTRAHP